jgi:four helix bundle protein
MPTITRFEDIESWQKARELTREIYALTIQAPFSRDYSLRDQIRRASISVMSNIAEGFERDGNREFAQFLSTAKASVGEVKSHLYVALDVKWISEESFRRLYALAEDTSRLLGGFLRYLEDSALRGAKFRAR